MMPRFQFFQLLLRIEEVDTQEFFENFQQSGEVYIVNVKGCYRGVYFATIWFFYGNRFSSLTLYKRF